jgi:hypothetical protein
MRWGLILILAIVVPIGTRTIRDIVAGYGKLFGVFDKETEEKLKLYKSLTPSCSESGGGMRRLFKEDDTYATFQEGIRRVVFDKTSDIVIIVTVCSIAAFVLYNTVYEKTVLRAVTLSYPLLILELFVDAHATAFLILALSYILVFGIWCFYVLSRLGSLRNDLSVWNYVQYLRGTPAQDRSFVSYWRFHDLASAIGRRFSGVAFRIVLLMASGGLAQILYNVSTSTMVSWILAAIPVVLSVLVLVLPLNSLHRVLQDAKVAVLTELEEAYDQLTLRFMIQLTEQRHSRPTGRAENAGEGLAAKVNSLKGIIDETREQPTWPIEAPVVLRIVATSLIPLVYSFVQQLIRELWLH